MTRPARYTSLYLYIDINTLFTAFVGNGFNHIKAKLGEAIKQTVEVRVHQQDTSSNSDKLFIVASLRVPGTKIGLDGRVRKALLNMDNWQKYNKEWMNVRVSDLIDRSYNGGLSKFKFDYNVAFEAGYAQKFVFECLFSNEAFIKLLGERFFEDVNKVVNNTAQKTVELRPWQYSVSREMAQSDRKNFLLSLAPRAGKTITVLEYVKLTVKNTGKKIVLVPASKNLSSNTSFINDYNDFGYNKHGGFLMANSGSLFRDDELLIESLRQEVPKGYSIIIVTDEADLGSHTEISREKLSEIHSNFDVVSHIAMSGTGIYRAAKIFGDVPESDIHRITLSYQDMLATGIMELVRRNIVNVHLKVSEFLTMNNGAGYLSITESLNDPETYPHLAKYLYKFVADDNVTAKFSFSDSDVIMVFVNAKTKKKLANLAKTFEGLYSSKVKVLTVTGDETNNREVEARTKAELKVMKDAQDKRKLVIFSMGMASRSYSIPQIRRVVIMSDGYISNKFLQCAARCLTYNYGSPVAFQKADIIRISFEHCVLENEVFCLEHDQPFDYSPTMMNKVQQFFHLNTFAEIVYSNDESTFKTIREGINTATAIEAYLDELQKFQDNTKYLVGRWYGLKLKVGSATFIKPSKTTSTSGIKTTKGKNKNSNKPKIDKEDEMNLTAYTDLCRVLPYIFELDGIKVSSVADILAIEEWDFDKIEKDVFEYNINEFQRFREDMEGLFRNAENAKATDPNIFRDKIKEYTAMI